MIHHLIKSQKLLFTKQRLLSLLLVLNIIVSCLVICFSYGLYKNYTILADKGEQEAPTDISVLCDSENYIAPNDLTDVKFTADVTPGMVLDMVNALSDDTKNALDTISVSFITTSPLSTPEDGVSSESIESDSSVYSKDKEPYCIQLDCHFAFENGKLIDKGQSAGYFTNEQFNNGEKVCVVMEHLFEPQYQYATFFNTFDISWTMRSLPLDTGSIKIGDDEYKIVKILPDTILKSQVIVVPITALPEDAKAFVVNYGGANSPTRRVVHFYFKKPMTKEQYADISDCMVFLGGSVYLEEISFTDVKDIYYYRTIMLISVVIAVLAAINMAILYRYILEKRSSQLAIFRICGCSKGRAVASYLLECLSINIPLFILTQLVYHKLIIPRLKDIFPNLADAYSFKLYAAIFGLYIAASTIVMLIMIIHTVRSHSLVALKSAGKSTGKAGGIMKVFEVIQLAAVLSMMVIIVSAINSRYALYTPFEKYFDRKGYLVAAADPMTYDKDFESVAGTSDIIMSQQTSRVIGDVSFDGIAYDDEFIESYAPPLEDGVWLSDTDITYEKDGYIPAVITSCGGRYKVGDVLSHDYDLYNSVSNSTETVKAKFKIIGVVKDKANIASYFFAEPLRYPDHRGIYNVFSDEFENVDWLLTRLSDEYACFKGSSLVWGTQFVFYDGVSDEEFKQHGNDLNGKFTAVALSEIKENSMQYIYEQMYTLFPIAVCIFILTIISTVSISAIYTKRQLRNYAIFYICGARWRTCALRSLKNSAITCGIAAAISAIVLIVGKLTLLKETVISFGIWHFGVCAGVIVLYLVLSMIMPLAIIGSNEPKEVLKEE